jgi:RecA-family ATPase
MDRASGSGVFARDPDAMLDMTELEPTEAIRAQLENKATCAECCKLLDKRGHTDDYGPDDALSKTQMLAICKKYLNSADLRMLDVEIEKAKKRALAMTAWRIEGTLREFARFDPVNLWFDYPIHKLDTGLLEDLQPDTGDMRTRGRTGAKKRWGKESAAERTKQNLSAAYESCKIDGEVTIYSMAEYLDLKPATVKKKLHADGGYWVEDEKVGRKEPGSNG